jgi:hypothetical protein
VQAEDGLSLDSVYFNNDVGGTEQLPAGRYRVCVLRSFDDPECGQRVVADLLEEAGIAIAKAAGTTGSGDPTTYRPTRVYFDARQLEPDGS